MFIVFEGIEGCGKSTQAQKLKLWLETQGKKVYLTKAPGGTEIGKIVREFLLHSKEEVNDYAELLLYKADEAQHVHQIKNKLQEGYVVISDRYCFSTIAYQGHGRGIPLGLIERLNAISTQGLMPNILFIIDADLSKSLERSKIASGRYDRFESLPIDFHQKVQRAYKDMDYSFQHVINGNKSIEETFEIIKKITNEHFLQEAYSEVERVTLPVETNYLHNMW